MPTTTIDIHPHIISGDSTRYPLAPLGGHQSDWSRTRPVTLEQLVAAMDTAGVQKAAIVQASTCYGHDNSYLADAVSACSKRFTGVFSVDVLAPGAPERMHHWRVKGLTGMRLFTFGSTMSEQADWLDDPKSYPAWACASELGLSICLQMSAKAIPQVISMAERFRRCASFSITARVRNWPTDRPIVPPPACLPSHVIPMSTLNLRPAFSPNPAVAKPRLKPFFRALFQSSVRRGLHGGQIILPAKAACRNSWTLRDNRWPVYRMPIGIGSLSRLRGRFTRCSRIEERICDVDHHEDQVVHTARRLSEHDGAQER